MPRTSPAFVLSLLTLHTLLRVYGRQCFCTKPECVNNICELSDDDFYHEFCEVAVTVTGNNTEVRHYCVVGTFSDNCVSTSTVFYHCCKEEDFCNRCAIPLGLPHIALEQLGQFIDPQCNYTVPESSSSSSLPSSSLSPTPSLTALSPPNATMQSTPTSPPELSRHVLYVIVGLSSMVVVCLVIAVALIICICCKNNERHKTDSLGSLPTFDDAFVETTSMTSGSGSGQRLLEQRTIARQIKKIEVVGKGRYGEVWLGDWGGESVAVKIFSSQDEDSWTREGEVYSTYMLHHDNIAKFIACDKRPHNLGFELWMVMEYHPHGSLLDYLLTHTLTLQQSQSFVYSIASGLHYLHVDIQTGAQIKPGIAHRDLKSKNILVKHNNTCCISDFGLAVRHIGSTGHVDISSINPRQGTKRYMAPEILDGTISFTKFDSYKMVDIYCFGLIIWEISRRTGKKALEYQLPYYQHVNHDPSMEDMRKVVCTDKVRPPIESWWMNDELLSLMSSLMQECWRNNPWARLSALRVKKNIVRKGLEKFECKNGFSNHIFS